jgi:hypothetical protein
MVKYHQLKNVRRIILNKYIQFSNKLGLEMPVATQKTDTGLTLGLLKILHRQV